ncbi:MAG: FAD-dependent oxidoreductase, partial [Cyanobacteria bacterium P01_A01_bin.83]
SGESAWMETGYLVDATGRQSRITKRLGATSTVCDSLVGISAFLNIPEGRPKTEQILVESIPQGWWYSAWLPDGSLTVVLMTDIDLMRQQQLHQEQQWIHLLSQSEYISKIVKGGNLIYPLMVKPAYSQIIDCAVGEDWMAIGDAAAAFDPLSSMGIGHAMTSGSHAGVALIEYLKHNNEQLLQQYQRGLTGNFETYLQLRHMYYSLEKRWLEQPFWQRRTKLAAAEFSNVNAAIG